MTTVIALDIVGSTNDEAMSRLRAGLAAPFVVTAKSQTGGRGRHGRVWASPPGNLYMSLALRDPAPVVRAPQLGFVAGVALTDALRRRLGGDARLRLKWPNDIQFSGAKVAGMLLESTVLPNGAFGCVIGIGVNCRSHPVDLSYAATNLCAVGDDDVSPDAVLADFLVHFDIHYSIWNGGDGFGAVREAWLSRAAGLGEPVVVATRAARRIGIFRDLDASGRLLLDADGDLVAIDAGDVFFPALAAVDG